MSDEYVKELSLGYRSSRKIASIFCGLGIAWSAAQFEIKLMSVGELGGIDLGGASIPLIFFVLCMYSMSRCTIEYMMQSDLVRRWSLAQLDFKITLYLFRFALIALTTSVISRTWEMLLAIAVAFLVALIVFFILVGVLMIIVMPIRLKIRKLKGRISVANAAIESTAYSFYISGVIYIVSFILVGLNVINPFAYLGNSYQQIPYTQLAIFSIVCLTVLISFFFDRKFLNIVFAFVPAMIEKTYFENGKKIFSIEPNPDHPDYENLKQSNMPFVYTKKTKEPSSD